MWLKRNLRWCSPLLLLFIIAIYVSKVSCECSSSTFECSNGRCIPLSWRCDDDDDCGDDSDENSCESRTCSESEFKCANAKCVPNRWLCDDEDDCGDKSDEDPKVCQNVTCPADKFSCNVSSGMCIPITWRCDGQEDCPDGSDEKEDCRQITCTDEEFTCANNKCITLRWRCDQDDDCGDGSEEINCPNVTCSSSEFMCSNGKCIPDRWRCDGDVDCTDNSDEHACSNSELFHSRCNAKEFMCDSRDCIHKAWVCDGDPDCPDKSDEKNCTITCRQDQFQCHSNQCIPGPLQCNGVKECTDGSDETNCPTLNKVCNQLTEFECAPGHCIPLRYVCNGKNDCGNWEDEPIGKCHVNECQKNNGGCSQKCVDSSAGYRCECYSGYQLADNKTCEDINECEIPGSCSQLCENTKGSFKCSCLQGYFLEPVNHHRCKAQNGHLVLLFSNRFDIRRINLETWEYTSVASGLRSTVAMDYHYWKEMIIWTDVVEQNIKSAPLPNASPINIVTDRNIGLADGIAIDWIHDLIYWTDTLKNSIEVSDLSGNNRKLLISEKLDEPRAIVVNPIEGWMFWSDWGDPAQIERAGMDGSHRSVVINSDVLWPNGLCLDLVSKRLFWVDAKQHTLSSSDYDGSNRRVVISSHTVLSHPFSIDVFEDWVFWTDWETEAIHKANKFTGQEKSVVVNKIFSPMDVHVFHSYKQPLGVNYCNNMNGMCSHLCLPAPKITKNSANYSCACPDGMILDADRRTCLQKVTSTTVSTTQVASSTSKAVSSTKAPYVKPSPRYFTPSANKKWPSHTNSNPRFFPTTTSSASSHVPEKDTVLVTASSNVYTSTVETVPTASQNSNDTAEHPVLNLNTSSLIQSPDGEDDDEDDSGKLAGIIIACLMCSVVVSAVILFAVYRYFFRRSRTSLNFDNPVYRKTTEDQFSLEKNQYHSAHSYPSSLEPLTSPGTNEFV